MAKCRHSDEERRGPLCRACATVRKRISRARRRGGYGVIRELATRAWR